MWAHGVPRRWVAKSDFASEHTGHIPAFPAYLDEAVTVEVVEDCDQMFICDAVTESAATPIAVAAIVLGTDAVGFVEPCCIAETSSM